MARKRRTSRRGSSPAQRRQQARMRRASKTCKGRKAGAFRACMRRELRK